jgi:hypothetical protein
MQVNGQFHAPAALLLGKEPTVPTVQEAGWPESRSGRYGEVKNLFPNRESNPCRPSYSWSIRIYITHSI